MLNRITAGYIIFEFEKHDWNWDWKNFLADLKTLVPSSEREYDPDTKVWSIKVTKENQMHFQALKKRYFTDPNQEEMF